MTATTAEAFDWDALRNISTLQVSENPADRQRLIHLLHNLSTSSQGWQLCASVLTENGNGVLAPLLSANASTSNEGDFQAVKFFCCRVIEDYLKSGYPSATPDDRMAMRSFLSSWLHKLVHRPVNGAAEEPVFMRNKAAQLITLVFLTDYPGQWPSFFVDLLEFVNEAVMKEGFSSHLTLCSLDIFLRALISVYSEIVTRECPIVLARNTKIKDFMRDNDVSRLVESWFYILEQSVTNGTESITRLILKVISQYISWIELTLIANRRFLDVFLRLLASRSSNGGQTASVSVRRKVLACLAAVVTKGMPPGNKLDLVEWLTQELAVNGVLGAVNFCGETQDTDYLERLGFLVDIMGTQLIDAYNRLMKEEGNSEKAEVCLRALEHKVDLALPLVDNPDNEVSISVIQLVHDYITLLKARRGIFGGGSGEPLSTNNNVRPVITAVAAGQSQDGDKECSGGASPLTKEQKTRVQQILNSVVNKMKYEADYNFEREGEDEASFQEYRGELRTIVSNLAQLDPNLVLRYTRDLLGRVLTAADGRQPGFTEVEVALSLFYHLGEAVKAQKGDFFCKGCAHREILEQMMYMVCSSRVSACQHSAVQLQYFECLVRYEKYFNYNTELISDVLTSFLDDRGVRNPQGKVRARSAYLLSRFIRSHKSQVQDYIEVILRELSDLLALPVTTSNLGSNNVANNNNSSPPLSQLEVSYIYETAAQLIVVGSPEKVDKLSLFRTLHHPILSKYSLLVERLRVAGEVGGDIRLVQELAQSLKDSAELISRTSRPFNPNQSMQGCGCVPAFLDALGVLLSTLELLPLTVPGRPLVCVGVRTFLHRMVICMDDPPSSSPANKAALDETLLSRLPHAILLLIRAPGAAVVLSVEGQSDICRDLRDLVPLINQILSRYKSRALNLLQTVLPSLLSTILMTLRYPPETNNMDAAEEMKLLRRAYLQLVGNLISTLPEALASLDSQALEEVLCSVVKECTACAESDPQAVKICFVVFRQMVLAWATDPVFLRDLVYPHVIPALFFVPARPGFDLCDGQFSLALKEAANCHRAILQKQGDSLVDFLSNTFLPGLNMQSPAIDDFVRALRGSQNDFQIYLNRFYTSAKQTS